MNDISVIPSSSNFEGPQFLRENEIVLTWLIQKKEGTTRRNYRREVENFFAHFPGVSLREISTAHLSAFLEERSRLSIASKRFARDVLSSMLTFAVKIGYIGQNPAAALDPIRVPDRTSSRLLTEEQVFRIIDRADTVRDRCLMKLLYVAGLRRAEISKLKWTNFYERAGGVQIVVNGKGGKVRSIILPRSLWVELQELRTQSAERSDTVFISRKGRKPLQPSQIYRIVKRAADKAKINANVSPHWFRHGHATHALERGAPIHLVQKTLGHASVATTGKYLDASPSESSAQFLGFA